MRAAPGRPTRPAGRRHRSRCGIGTPDEPARPGSDDVERFAARVRQLSGGRVRIKIVWEAGGRDLPRREPRVAELVRTGTLDAALVPARTWDLEGVTSLQALQAPFLITSEALVERVLTSALAGEMLAGLQKAGVTGLVLLPESLRHPFGFGHALRAPADFAAATIQSPLSNASHATCARWARGRCTWASGPHPRAPGRDGRRPRVIVPAGRFAARRQHRHR